MITTPRIVNIDRVDVPPEAPPAFQAELRELNAILLGGVMVLPAPPLPRHWRLFRGFVSFGKARKS